MKKLFTLVLLITAALQGHTQITITQNDLPKAGQTIVLVTDYSDTGFVITPQSGSPQHWDYSTKFKNIDDSSTVPYLAPVAMPHHSEFPGASFGINSDNTYESYYKTDVDGLWLLGNWSSPQFSSYDTLELWNPEYLLMPTPFTYDDSRIYTAKLVVTGYNTDLAQYVRAVDYIQGSFYSDAYGSIVTPVLSSPNVLRIQDHELEYDTTYASATLNGTYTIFDTSSYNETYYYFVGNGPQLNLMEIDIDNKTALFDGAYYTNLISTGVDKLPLKSEIFTSIYPNPSHAAPLTFTITGAQGHQLKIYNMVGECVETENVDGVYKITITNNLLSSGLYLYQITNKAGQLLAGNKFVVE